MHTLGAKRRSLLVGHRGRALERDELLAELAHDISGTWRRALLTHGDLHSTVTDHTGVDTSVHRYAREVHLLYQFV